MVRILRENLLDPIAPNPSVEILSHAFLPHKFIDHTHATAVLSLTDQPDGEAICAEVFDGRVGLVPYLMPGFALAKKLADVYEAAPKVEGLILIKHGIFTFGADAREAYERMIALVTLAEERLARNRKAVFTPARLPERLATPGDVAPILRGAVSLKDDKIEGAWRRLILEFRGNPAMLDFVNGTELSRYSQAGVVTPDHTIRTKNWPLVVASPESGKSLEFKRAAQRRSLPSSSCQGYFTATMPAPADEDNIGSAAAGRSFQVSACSAWAQQDARPHRRRSRGGGDRNITDAEAIGRFNRSPSGHVRRWNTGRLGTSQARHRQGPALAARSGHHRRGRRDRCCHCDALRAAAPRWRCSISTNAPRRRERHGHRRHGHRVRCDVTDAASVRAAFEQVVAAFGGVDIAVSNAGAAWQGRIGEVDEDILRRSFELNFYGHQRVAQAAVKIMLAQGTGGCLLFNVSKQAVNPGPNFGPWLPKAATLFLVRQYAWTTARWHPRQRVNADRIRSGLLTDDFIKERSQARGLSETDYMRGNLLQREVTAEDVAQAFLAQALALKTTADVTTVDGGNIAAALR
jgi:NAD(P)-dependent dehydrogenase (short-subunit alcohol dehydrogenase family)